MRLEGESETLMVGVDKEPSGIVTLKSKANRLCLQNYYTALIVLMYERQVFSLGICSLNKWYVLADIFIQPQKSRVCKEKYPAFNPFLRCFN